MPSYGETSQLICRANQLTGFYMMATLAFNELILKYQWIVLWKQQDSEEINDFRYQQKIKKFSELILFNS